MSTTDLIGYRISSLGKELLACLSCAGDAEYNESPKEPIQAKDGTDEGYFITCQICDEYLDKAGYEHHMAEGQYLASTYVPKTQSSGNLILDYRIAKGQCEPLD